MLRSSAMFIHDRSLAQQVVDSYLKNFDTGAIATIASSPGDGWRAKVAEKKARRVLAASDDASGLASAGRIPASSVVPVRPPAPVSPLDLETEVKDGSPPWRKAFALRYGSIFMPGQRGMTHANSLIPKLIIDPRQLGTTSSWKCPSPKPRCPCFARLLVVPGLAARSAPLAKKEHICTELQVLVKVMLQLRSAPLSKKELICTELQVLVKVMLRPFRYST